MALSNLQPVANRDDKVITLSGEARLTYASADTRTSSYLETFRLNRHDQRGTSLSFDFSSVSTASQSEAARVELVYSNTPITDASVVIVAATLTIPTGVSRAALKAGVEGRVIASVDNDALNQFQGVSYVDGTGVASVKADVLFSWNALQDVYFGLRLVRTAASQIVFRQIRAVAVFGISRIRRYTYDPLATPEVPFA